MTTYDEVAKATWHALTQGRPLSKAALLREVKDATGATHQKHVESALALLVKIGDAVAIQGRDIPWTFYDKRDTPYYFSAVIWKQKMQERAEAEAAKEDERRRELAEDDADMAMRQKHPVEWRQLFDEAYKKRGGKP